MRNKIGPNVVTGTVLEDIPFTTTVCVQSVRKVWIQTIVFLVYHSSGVYKESEGVVPYQML